MRRIRLRFVTRSAQRRIVSSGTSYWGENVWWSYFIMNAPLADEIQIVPVPSWGVKEVWPRLDGWIEGAVKRSNGRYTKRHVFEYCESARWQLWMAWDALAKKPIAVIVTQILVNPTGIKALDVIIVTGRGYKKWATLAEQKIEDWARDQGCTISQAIARKGWAKVFKDHKQSHIFLEKAL